MRGVPCWRGLSPLLLLAALVAACGDDDATPAGIDAGATDAAGDADGDTDTDSDTDADTGTGPTELCPDGVLDDDFTITNDIDFELIDDCVEITGTLCMIICVNCESLAPLAGLTTIGGDLQIIANEAIVDLTGLDSLAAVGGELMIIENETLASLAGLGALESVGGNLIVTDNELLPYCEICELVEHLGGLPPDAGLTANLGDECGSDAGLYCDGGLPDAAADAG
jgi:hypothetical protein